jgi:hypothetical protein
VQRINSATTQGALYAPACKVSQSCAHTKRKPSQSLDDALAEITAIHPSLAAEGKHTMQSLLAMAQDLMVSKQTTETENAVLRGENAALRSANAAVSAKLGAACAALDEQQILVRRLAACRSLPGRIHGHECVAQCRHQVLLPVRQAPGTSVNTQPAQIRCGASHVTCCAHCWPPSHAPRPASPCTILHPTRHPRRPCICTAPAAQSASSPCPDTDHPPAAQVQLAATELAHLKFYKDQARAGRIGAGCAQYYLECRASQVRTGFSAWIPSTFPPVPLNFPPAGFPPAACAAFAASPRLATVRTTAGPPRKQHASGVRAACSAGGRGLL